MAKVYTYSVVRTAALSFSDQVPYVVAVLEEDGKRFSTRIDGYEEGMSIEIDQEVTYAYQDALGNAIYKF